MWSWQRVHPSSRVRRILAGSHTEYNLFWSTYLRILHNGISFPCTSSEDPTQNTSHQRWGSSKKFSDSPLWCFRVSSLDSRINHECLHATSTCHYQFTLVLFPFESSKILKPLLLGCSRWPGKPRSSAIFHVFQALSKGTDGWREWPPEIGLKWPMYLHIGPVSICNAQFFLLPNNSPCWHGSGRSYRSSYSVFERSFLPSYFDCSLLLQSTLLPRNSWCKAGYEFSETPFFHQVAWWSVFMIQPCSSYFRSFA